MSPQTMRSDLFDEIGPEHVKFFLLAIISVASIPAFFWVIGLFFTALPTMFFEVRAIAILAVLLPTVIAYAIACRLGSERAARWTAGIVLLAGTVVGWATVLAFRV